MWLYHIGPVSHRSEKERVRERKEREKEQRTVCHGCLEACMMGSIGGGR